MKVAFLSENGLEGKVPRNFGNMRTEFAWMCALEADHYNIYQYYLGNYEIKEYDHIFIIFPKGEVYTNAAGAIDKPGINSASVLFNSDIVEKLKSNNKNVYYVQEGPHWWWDNYSVADQFALYNQIMQCDRIYAHNEYDVKYYKGMFLKDVRIIPSLMIEDSLRFITPIAKDKVIIGGNFSSWYYGFESYMVASEFKMSIWAQTSHSTKPDEPGIEDLNHFPRLSWVDWMKELSEFKYAVHLMPTVAAGTFSLNCAYFGIPCIGNENVDTQATLFPELSIGVHDVIKAKQLAIRLLYDKEFYNEISQYAKKTYKETYSEQIWKKNIKLEEI